jgi:hypothetical protein
MALSPAQLAAQKLKGVLGSLPWIMTPPADAGTMLMLMHMHPISMPGEAARGQGHGHTAPAEGLPADVPQAGHLLYHSALAVLLELLPSGVLYPQAAGSRRCTAAAEGPCLHAVPHSSAAPAAISAQLASVCVGCLAILQPMHASGQGVLGRTLLHNPTTRKSALCAAEPPNWFRLYHLRV